jgi:hypothetical protein
MSVIRALIVVLLLTLPPSAQLKFAVSGDSRNCGNVVMPLIAADAAKQGAQFYWHLGDLRALNDIDQDMQMRPGQPHLSITDYEKIAWSNFIANQISAFGAMPFFLGIGNHELYVGHTRHEFISQFADWLNSPVLRDQRLRDDPTDHRVKTYFHWIQNGTDFIYLDNATPDQFDAAQMKWIAGVLKRAGENKDVRTVVVGMHQALPDSLASGHSMNDFPQTAATGRKVYQQLLDLHQNTHKPVYVLASHSHFFMANIFNTGANRARHAVLPGWIAGTAGAFNYKLPDTSRLADAAMTGVYGYLLATVQPSGEIKFEFRETKESDVATEARSKFGQQLMDYCFKDNREK